ncbi:uncharacterized protein LOC110457943 isoform X2 [Mizuhopecten yessoensis]|uniref:uncharacterized protein LOC110457943 isoform X2 n=1 Tax=Mizuhopecten yessoensis TaxID=6573 RepID=UPI000B45AC2E|nr:uncharacterized protein LOC110457943 isoform X2 [Mizuhopecten yessoensis]
MESTLGAVFNSTEFTGSNTCVVTSATDNVPMDEFCALYRQRIGLPNVNTSIYCADGRACGDNCRTVTDSLTDQNVKQKEDSKSMTDNALVWESRKHGDSRFPGGEKRYLEEITIKRIEKKQKSQKTLKSHGGKRLEINTKRVTKDNTEKIGQKCTDGYRIPISTIGKKESRYTENSCPPLKIKTDKEFFGQSMESFPQSNKHSKENIKCRRELNTEPITTTSDMYMVRNTQSQYQQTPSDGTALTPRQYDHGDDYSTVDSLRPSTNEETMPNDTTGDGNTVGATLREQVIPDLQANKADLQQSGSIEDDDRKDEVCRSSYPVRNPKFADEPARNATYLYWEQGDPSVHSEAGFFYTGDDDVVRCFHCDIGIGGWDLTSDPWTEHARYSPDCPFLRNIKSQEWIDNIQANWRQIFKPKHPEYQQMDARQKTFENDEWRQINSSITPERLAEAGFFLEGNRVKSYYCDGILRKDGSTDEPWLIHAKTFPFCKFVQTSKGNDFIEKHSNDLTGIERPGHHLPVAAGQEGHVLRLSCVKEFCIKEERDPMWSAAAQSLLTMGYDRKNITGAIKAFISRTGRRDFDAGDLIDIIQEHEQAFFENKRLRNRLLCKSCRTRDVMNISLPCGHLVCQQCAAGLVKCARCNNTIKENVRIYVDYVR